MHASIHAALLFALVLAGCASDEPDIDAASAGDADATNSPSATDGPWAATAEGALGWVVGAGTHVFAGDAILGVRSHEQCPRALWTVAEGATRLVVELGAGPGPTNLALAGPDGVTYTLSPDGSALTVEADTVAAGAWSAELKPVGAAPPQTRALRVQLEGVGTAPAEITLQPDADCLL